MTTERRQFNRVAFDTQATIEADSQITDCNVVDLSLHGALISTQKDWNFPVGTECRLSIPLSNDGDSEADEKITMTLKLAHHEADHIGLECQHIDLDSMTHLRRLVELNLENSDLLERDFEALCHEHS